MVPLLSLIPYMLFRLPASPEDIDEEAPNFRCFHYCMEVLLPFSYIAKHSALVRHKFNTIRVVSSLIIL